MTTSSIADTGSKGREGPRRFAPGPAILRMGAFVCFGLILLYFAIFGPGFLSSYNLINVIEQSAILGVLAFGLSVVIIGGGSNVTEGGLDLSIAANMGLCAAVFATMLQNGHSDFAAVIAALATGCAIGGLNAIAVVGCRILPLLGTLAVMNIAAGAELTLTENTVVTASSPLLTLLSSGSFLGISALAWCLVIVTGAMFLIIHQTSVGLRLYAVGEHFEAARAAGINVRLYRYATYVFAGLCAGIASILMVSRLSASTPGSNEMFLSIIAAALLGTVFSRRFVPTIGGTLLSVLFIGFLANGFQLLNVSSYWVNGVQGALILIVVAATSFARGPEAS